MDNMRYKDRIALINDCIGEHVKKERDAFEKCLIDNSHPKITGQITKAKLRWRGICIIVEKIGFNTTKWIEQRGKQISPKFTNL